MHAKLTGRRAFLLMSIACLVYFMSYLTRLNYTAALAEICNALNIGRQEASLPITGCFIVYGAGQLICGFLGDKLPPRNMIFTGLFLSAACNISVALTNDIFFITILWSINGFAQAMLWPSLVKAMADHLSGDDYRKCCFWVYAASSAGTISVYFLVPVCVLIFNWRTVFILSAALAAAAAVIWFIIMTRLGCRTIEPAQPQPQSESSGTRQRSLRQIFASVPVVSIFTACIIHGALRDGITTWMPIYIGENFNISNSLAIITTAVLPTFGIVSVAAASKIIKTVKNEVLASAIMFLCAAVSCPILMLFQNSSAGISVMMMTVMTGCMHGVNLFLISHAPKRFERLGKISFVSGVLNAATYIGSALSTYIFAKISENLGWQPTFLCWFILIIISFSACLLAVKKWAGFCRLPLFFKKRVTL